MEQRSSQSSDDKYSDHNDPYSTLPVYEIVKTTHFKEESEEEPVLEMVADDNSLGTDEDLEDYLELLEEEDKKKKEQLQKDEENNPRMT